MRKIGSKDGGEAFLQVFLVLNQEQNIKRFDSDESFIACGAFHS